MTPRSFIPAGYAGPITVFLDGGTSPYDQHLHWDVPFYAEMVVDRNMRGVDFRQVKGCAVTAITWDDSDRAAKLVANILKNEPARLCVVFTETQEIVRLA